MTASRKRRLWAYLAAATVLTARSAWPAESVSGGSWQVSAEKGEIVKALLRRKPFLTRLGGFRVVGKKVRPFREVAELRERDSRRLVYEGIADDTKHLYVEFGQVIEADDALEFLLFLSWLPPSPWPADAVAGVLEFAPAVLAVEAVTIGPSETVLPGTCAFLAKLRGGGRVHIRAVGFDPEKAKIEKNDGHISMRFQESRHYVVSPDGRNRRSMAYWTSSTDTHYVRFTFSVDGPSSGATEGGG